METRKSFLLRALAAILITIFFLAAIETIYQRNLAEKIPRLEHQAAFGDSFGGLNTLFSGCAFIGISVTLLLQLEDIRWQRRCFSLQQKAQNYQVNISLVATYLSARTAGRGDDALLTSCEQLLENHLKRLIDHPERLNATL